MLPSRIAAELNSGFGVPEWLEKVLQVALEKRLVIPEKLSDTSNWFPRRR